MKILLTLILTLFLTSCKKEVEPIKETQVINYTCYSETGKFNLRYVNLNLSFTDTIINANNYTCSVTIYSDKLEYVSTMSSISINPTDSLFIRAESNGKKIEKGIRFKNANCNNAIQLNQMK